jgi:hypothetical protein
MIRKGATCSEEHLCIQPDTRSDIEIVADEESEIEDSDEVCPRYLKIDTLDFVCFGPG